MTTNIIAALTITLVTNSITRDNSRNFNMVPPGEVAKYVPPSEVYLTTNVMQHVVIRYVWDGQTNECVSQRLIWSATQTLKLKGQWEAEEVVKTNIAAPKVLSQP